jgi:hypothetical protein
MVAGKLNAISTRPPLPPSNDGREAVGNTLGMAILVSGSAAGAGEAGGMESRHGETENGGNGNGRTRRA